MLRDQKRSVSSPIAPPSELFVIHTTTHAPLVGSTAITGTVSAAVPSVVPVELRSAGALHVTPSSVERANRMSSSFTTVLSRFSLDCHTATHVPAPSVAMRGWRSLPTSDAAFVFKKATGDQAEFEFSLRENRRSRSPSLPGSRCQTHTLAPSPVATHGSRSSALSPPASELIAPLLEN